jgi:hypothetical protein
MGEGGGQVMMMVGTGPGGGVPVMVAGEELSELRAKVEELRLRVPDLMLLQKVGKESGQRRTLRLSPMLSSPRMTGGVHIHKRRHHVSGYVNLSESFPISCLCTPITSQITEQVSALAQGLDAAEKGVAFLRGRVKELEARPSATDQVGSTWNLLTTSASLVFERTGSAHESSQ